MEAGRPILGRVVDDSFPSCPWAADGLVAVARPLLCYKHREVMTVTTLCSIRENNVT